MIEVKFLEVSDLEGHDHVYVVTGNVLTWPLEFDFLSAASSVETALETAQVEATNRGSWSHQEPDEQGKDPANHMGEPMHCCVVDVPEKYMIIVWKMKLDQSPAEGLVQMLASQ